MGWRGVPFSGIRASGRNAGRGDPMPGVGTGLWGLVAVLILGLFGFSLRIDPSQMIAGRAHIQAAPASNQYSAFLVPRRKRNHARDAQIAGFVTSVLAETREVWSDILPKQKGIDYVAPHLQLYKSFRRSPCGPLYTGMGPIYCPLDDKIYLDPGFFVEMKGRFGGAGTSAYTYMIAHEIGHGVQNQLGILRRIWAAQRSAFGAFGNAISIRIELMADCYAGVWANHAEANDHLITHSDVEKMILTAQAIGDDRLQLAALGRVVPNAFTHGTSRQRAQWFETGLKSGLVDACDTFGQ